MIRERLEQDIDRLCAVLEALENPSGALPEEDLRGWLDAYDAELSWVFDMAPVSAAPTKNVVGHLQVYSPDADSSAPYLEHTGKSAGELLAIGRHFVKPGPYAQNIGRFLLRESVAYIRRRGRTPVLELPADGFLPRAFYERFGFQAVPSPDPGRTPMVCTR
ncbi:GNAT family N-acetyltransferase [Streptomonospora sp. PA3]|uniref:GNAT family N-acetyltransferase n=1 Tax=Streptomonospora sp. PA3 TaxID=2607326 RepID=UPI0012DD0E66|nr:GNAT family N-acetyltransferase [Streptomonospora sp. PA3]MUL44332.1 GNAT family N-acetyltransferase [Streptomonospora sp. PA3]